MLSRNKKYILTYTINENHKSNTKYKSKKITKKTKRKKINIHKKTNKRKINFRRFKTLSIINPYQTTKKY